MSTQQVQIAHCVVLLWLVGPQCAFLLGFEEAVSPEQLRSDRGLEVTQLAGLFILEFSGQVSTPKGNKSQDPVGGPLGSGRGRALPEHSVPGS